jgi:RHS repeat-associated protein
MDKLGLRALLGALCVGMGLSVSGTAAATVVGATVGSFGVSPKGAATYHIPLKLPSGVAGLQPTLSLDYSSTGGDQFMGKGWSIGGISLISRCPTTRAQDGYTQGIFGNSGDRFCLDGQHLVTTSGQYGAVGAEYRTQIESFSRIVSTGGTAGFPAYFTVKTKSGLTMTYGQTSKVNIPNGTYQWLLDSTTDSVGNTITYTYNYNPYNGDYYPATITYGGNTNAGTSASITVTFTWTPRPFWAPAGFVDGHALYNYYFLSRIDTAVNNVVARHWKLAYPDNLVLGSITECTGSDETQCANPTQFTWDVQTPAGTTVAVQNVGNFATPFQYYPAGLLGTGPFVGDFNGDGKADVLTLIGDSSGNFTAQIAWSGGTGGYSVTQALPGQYPTPTTPSSVVRFLTADFNADGKTDLVVETIDSAGAGKTTLQFLFSNGTGSFSKGPTLISSSYANTPAIGDFNGDGIPDVLIDINQYALSTGPGSFQLSNPSFTGAVASPLAVYAADLNGDGLADVVEVYNLLNSQYYVYTYLNRGTNGTPVFSQNPDYTLSITPSNPGINAGDTQFYFADVNGDGNVDFIYTTDAQSQSGNNAILTTGVALSTGDGKLLAPVETSITEPNYPWTSQVGNFDGDGRASVAWAPTLSGQSMAYQESIGYNSFFNVNVSTASPISTGTASFLMAGDFLGHAQDQLFNYSVKTASNPSQLITPLLPGDKRITKITDAYGETMSIAYTPITSSPTVYSDTGCGVTSSGCSGAITFPNLPMRTGYSVVSQTNVMNPGNPDKATSYKYANARFNWQGLGFLGFARVTATDISWLAGGSLQTFTDYHQDFPFIGQVLDSSVTDLPTGHTVHGTFETWKSKALSFGSNFVYLDSSQTQDWDLQTGVVYRTRQYSGTYDDYGCPQTTTNTVYTGDVGATPTYTTSTTNTITEDTTNWFLCRITDTQVTKAATGQPNITRESSFGYDPGTGLLTEETIQPSDKTDQYLDTTYQRDGFGNIHLATTSGSSTTYLTPRTVTYDYSPDGRFNTSICNPLQPCTNFTYYPDTGNLNTMTDPNGVVTTYTQDTFGRPSGSSIRQADLNVSSSVTWYGCTDANISSLCAAALTGANGQALGVYGQKITASDGSASAIIYDAAQRPVLKGELNGGGSWIETLTQYDVEGRPYRVSASAYLGITAAAAFWTTMSYDDLNRPTQTVAPQDQYHPTGSTTLYAYNGLTTTITDARQHTKTITKTALGQPASALDDSQSPLTYTYDAYGNLLQTVDVKGNTVAMTYDVRGRKTRITDPDMGTWTYAYDALGEVITQKNAKLIGGKSSFGYDVLGRMTSRSNADNSYTWTWDKGTGAQWYGAPIEATMFPAGSTTPVYDRRYTYTDFGGLQTDTQTTNGTAYVTSYGYDTLGRVNRLTYPSTFAVNIGYNGYGAESSIVEAVMGGLTLWSANAWDEWGHISQETMGGGAIVNGVYLDPAVGNIYTILAGPNGSASVASYSYGWDQNGNTTQRVNQTLPSAQTETFGYDNLDRMQTDTVTNPVSPTANVTLGYDAIGNVSSKSDLTGSYAYTLGLPHAVSSAGGMTFGYDKNGNMTGITGSDKRNYTWTADNRLSNAKDVTSTYQVGFQYGADGELVSQVASWGLFYNKSETTLYLGDGLEEAASGTLGTTTKDYILTPTGPVAMVVHAPSSADAVQYLQKDNLGSIVAVTDANGAVIQNYVYDTVGKRTATFTASGYSGLLTDLGYTGHLQIDALNLVHMKGRVYDATIARFLSPDPTVPDPTDLQSYNRYSYVRNNPLTAVDPSGFNDVPGNMVTQMAMQDSYSTSISFGGGSSLGGSGAGAGAGSNFSQVTVMYNDPTLTGSDTVQGTTANTFETTVFASTNLPEAILENIVLPAGGGGAPALTSNPAAAIGAPQAAIANATSPVTGANTGGSGGTGGGPASNTKSAAGGTLSAAANYAHGTLGGLSFVPGLPGAAALVVDAGIDVAQGNKKEAVLTITAAVIGTVDDAGFAKGALDVAKDVAQAAKKGMLGERGVKVASKTLWKGEGKARLDVENPNPGQRPGQIHYQDNDGGKYLYDPESRSFPDAPNSVNKMLENSRFLQAIEKGLTKYLGE